MSFSQSWPWLSLCVEILWEKHRVWWESTTYLCSKYITRSLKEDSKLPCYNNRYWFHCMTCLRGCLPRGGYICPGVSAQGDVCPGVSTQVGVCLGVSAWRCLSRGVFVLGWCLHEFGGPPRGCLPRKVFFQGVSAQESLGRCPHPPQDVNCCGGYASNCLLEYILVQYNF